MMKKDKTFFYYVFDWDNNILNLSTPMYFKKRINNCWKNVTIFPNNFAKIRKKYGAEYMDNPEWKATQKTAFTEFGDYGKRGNKAFMEDCIEALSNKEFGPSWDSFIQTIMEGRLFSIVTTRGHEPATIKRLVRYIIENVLTVDQKQLMDENLKEFAKFFKIKNKDLLTYYLNKCYFIGLFSKRFKKQFGYVPYGALIEKGKQDAIQYFIEYVRKFAQRHNKSLSVGFSDDDKHFSNAAKQLFIKMKNLNENENYYVFDTSNRKIKGGVRIKI